MIIQIPDNRWRIEGDGPEWQVQRPNKGKGSGWEGRYFFPSLEHAVGKAYELMLRESPASVDLKDVPAECAKAKGELLKAVRKAVAR